MQTHLLGVCFDALARAYYVEVRLQISIGDFNVARPHSTQMKEANDLSSSKDQELDRMRTVQRAAPLPLRWSTNPKGLGNLLHLCPVHILIRDAIFFVHVDLSVCRWTKFTAH